MAKKKEQKKQETPEETTPEEAPKKPGKFKKILKILLILLVIFGIAGVAGFFVMRHFKAKAEGYPALKMEHIPLEKPLLEFAWKKIPDAYFTFAALDTEIQVITDEIARIEEIEGDYPKQRKITSAEKRRWAALKKDLVKIVKRASATVESLYVGYLVNAVTGQVQIETDAPSLKKNLEEARINSEVQTKRLKPDPEAAPTGIMAKIRSFLPGG